MSAVFVLRQSDSIHMMTDAVSYLLDGTVMATNLTKATTMATLSAAISCPGPSSFQRMFADRVERAFDSFDDLVEYGEHWLADTFEDLAAEHRASDAMSTIYLIGWHDGENRPGGYVANFWTDASTQMAVVLKESGVDLAAVASERGKLKPIGEGLINGTPMPSHEWLDRAGFELRDAAEYDPSVDLLHLAEIARQELDGDGKSWVGGKAVLTSIERGQIAQRVIHRWKEDVVGSPIVPAPVDWAEWRAARAPAQSPGISRLRQQMLERKARKAAR
ncbi:MAG: hypothetical protein HY852_00385 [Bradyrhizobium sp.]|uniref:hypothetical protein n=1 Tax=Bradyrhizobium sp. TaxID=376 RepID=UPI0025BF8AB2|nr:hypothetical protein [Bradyrhizobium sp.]MBI5260258.1 hypothetical protein [Bradyrhizobium sp.]